MKGKKMNSRQHSRTTYSGTIAVWRDRQPHLMQARDLSAGGCFLATDERMGEGSLLTLRLSLPGERGMTVLGRVIRNQVGLRPLKRPGVAIEFLDIRPSDRARVDGYVGRAAVAC
ncbi:MAG: PilZ domain-containing protein [Pseudomonadota bacterium]